MPLLRHSMLMSFGRSSPSFIIAVMALVVAAVGYVAWTFLRPNPYARSEHIVREFARIASREVSGYRKKLRVLADNAEGKKEEDVASAITQIEDLASQAVAKVDDHADRARDDLAELDIRLNTQRNRTNRIRRRTAEAREMITDLAEEAKERLRGHE